MLRGPAAERNKQPILEVLKLYIGQNPLKIMEIASGSGQHIVHFAPHFPNAILQPSELDARSIHSINAYLDKYKFANVRVPLYIDITKGVERWILPEDFGPGEVDVMLNFNMIHISSNAAVDGLFKAAGKMLKHDGMLITYGPYAVDGKITPQSNVDFDEYLREQNSQWGLRDTLLLSQKALANGLLLTNVHDMPANNKTLIFRRN